jgi:glucokinase
MSDKLCCPVRIVNDLNAIAWGEATCGAAKGYNCVLVVYVGTGIGAGLILDGKLYTGSSGIAAEIGHVKVCEENGAPCGCGGRGCLEAYVGGGNLSARLRTEAPSWPALSKEAGGRLDAIHPGLVEVLFQRKDERAKHLWKDLGTKLGLVLANAVTLINPGALVLGGTVLDGCPSLRKYTEQVLENRAMPGSWKSLVVLSAKLGDNAGIIGAAMLGLL